jgi:hypothetical protein
MNGFPLSCVYSRSLVYPRNFDLIFYDSLPALVTALSHSAHSSPHDDTYESTTDALRTPAEGWMVIEITYLIMRLVTDEQAGSI